MPPGWIRCVAVDTCQPQRQGIDQCHVQVRARHGDRCVRSDTVDPVARRQLAAPALLIPVATLKPASFRCLAGRLGNDPDQFTRRGDLQQIDLGQALRRTQEVRVAVDKARYHECAVEIDPLCSATRGRLNGLLAQRGDAVAADSQRGNVTGERVARPDRSVYKGRIERRILRLQPCGQECSAGCGAQEPAPVHFIQGLIPLWEAALPGLFFCPARRCERRVAGPHKRAATPPGGKIDPALWVESVTAPLIVTRRSFGITKPRSSRLDWRRNRFNRAASHSGNRP